MEDRADAEVGRCRYPRRRSPRSDPGRCRHAVYLPKQYPQSEWHYPGRWRELSGKPRPNGPDSFTERSRLLDEVNVRLLNELHSDPRLTMSELARRVGMSAPAVTERVQRLERSGVITGFRMEVDPAALGMPVTALVRIRPGPGQLPKIVAAARDTPQVVECYRITGEDCFLLKVHGPSIGQLEDVLDRFLMFGQTTTSIVVSEPVPRRPLPIPITDKR
ncbi:Lrp/AsnC family transcriptional regulator [Saccharopolyspora shandongensis]|uniref:Lrp/AsnC family transcriptional regulator n=1 Tax=Saccharopolyspora shandongensis TaxID=418495 RepID=UPI0034479654